MKTYIKLIAYFAIIVTLTACGGLQQEALTPTNNLSSQYQQSNSDIDRVYQQLNASLSGKLKIALEENQASWRIITEEACGAKPQTDAKEQCFIAENQKRLAVLARHQQYLLNLVDSKLSALEEIDGEYEPSFDCMCNDIKPFIDTKNDMMIFGNFCDDVTTKYTIDGVVLTDDNVAFVMIDNNGSEFELVFKYEANQLYTIIIGGQYGMIKNMYFPPYYGNAKQHPVNTDLVCGDFDG